MMRVFVVTRFAVLIEQKVHSWNRLRNPRDPRTWFRPRNPTMAEKRAYLFNPDRLADRMARFERMLLPSVKAQSVAPEHVVVTSEDLPEPFASRLGELSEGYGFRLHRAGTERDISQILCEDGLISRSGTESVATIRVDDDDAIACDLVECIQSLSDLKLDDFVVTFPQGILLDERGAKLEFARVFRPSVACGLTRVTGPAVPVADVFGGGNHRKLNKTFPFLQLPYPDMFVVTYHGDNISHGVRRNRLEGAQSVDAGARELFMKRFGFSPA